MTLADRRAALEAIAFGVDPDLRPSDRLRALDHLRELGFDDEDDFDPDIDFRTELARLTDIDLDRELDAYLADQIAEALLAGDSERWPRLSALVAGAIEERARELARPAEVEAEIERRARERAAELYVQRGVERMEEELSVDVRPAAERSSVPEGIDPQRGWRKRTPRFGRP